MGFWDSLGKIAGEAVKGIADNVKETAERQQEYVDKYSCYDDDRLKKEFKRESDHNKKMAIAYVLKQRGYGKDN